MDGGEHLQDHVRAVTVGKGRYLFHIVRGAVVEDMLRSLLLYQFLSALGAGSANHAQPSRDGELHRRDAYAAAGAVNKDCFARDGLSLLEKRSIGGAVRHANGGALGKGGVIG